MDGELAQADATPIWIVLTPSADDDAWRDALRKGIVSSGFIMRDGDTEVPASTDDPTREVWITSDCLTAESLGRRPAAVLIPRPGTAPESVTEKLGIVPPQSVAHASLLLARAVAQDPRKTRVVTGRDIVAAQGSPIALTEWLSVTPPAPLHVEAGGPAVLAAFETYAGGAPTSGQSVVWSEPIFRYDQRAHRAAQKLGELDITGKPRILVYGPYLGMSPGRWRARVRFLVDRPAASKEFRLDWGSPHDFQTLCVAPPHAGVYEAELEHDWPVVDVAEIRLWLMEGAFDGVLHFLGATVTYLGRPLANAA